MVYKIQDEKNYTGKKKKNKLIKKTRLGLLKDESQVNGRKMKIYK